MYQGLWHVEFLNQPACKVEAYCFQGYWWAHLSQALSEGSSGVSWKPDSFDWGLRREQWSQWRRCRSICLASWSSRVQAGGPGGTEAIGVHASQPVPATSSPSALCTQPGMPASILPRKLGSLLTVLVPRHFGFISERGTRWAFPLPKGWKLVPFPPLGLRKLSTSFPLRETGK